jgi:adenylate cyclase
MAHLFVSYARQDEPQARRVADALKAEGYEVWRDDELPAHRTYAEVIEERLTSAKAVVVLWSSESAKSQWVRSEADAARQLGILVQASIDATVPPMPFDQIQSADLMEWTGQAEAPGWCKLRASVQELAGSPQSMSGTPRKGSHPVSVCVLPFQNMSGEAEQEYFSDGISEDITTDLSKVSALGVTARNTAFMFKGQSLDVGEIARKLGVSHVLEGSVRKAGSCVRITAQLIDGSTGEHVWAERYDRELTDIFSIQDEISEAIVSALRLTLLPDEKKAIEQRGTTNVDAYNLYLMARQYWVTADFGDRRREERVIRICQAATNEDPDYARAWALIGLAQANLHHGFSARAWADDGAAAAERALALDPTIAEAHLPMAWRLAEQGRFKEADAEIAAALELGPDSWEVNKECARILYRQRRMDEVQQRLEKSTELMEADYHGWGMLFACYNAQNNMKGRQECAQKVIAQVEPVLARDPDNGTAMIFGAMSLAALGEMERAKQWLDRAALLDPDNMFMRYNSAMTMEVFFGDREGAIEALEIALSRGGRNLVTLAANDPNIDGLRDDPRFKEMIGEACSRFGIVPSASSPSRSD